jgi:tRNA threonylcarbamoyladenosine biosynthesis protein TsaB
VLLALETACDPGGVALAQDGRQLAERVFEGREPPGAILLPAIQELLAQEGAALDRLSAIALSVGPGSFTGLRVGLATVLGLTFTRELPVVPVPTLAALALQALPVPGAPQAEIRGSSASPREAPDLIVPMLDARKGQIYTGLYRRDGQCVIADCVCDPLPWYRALAQRPGRFALLGSGLPPYGDAARAVLGERAELLASEQRGPRPASVARLGERLLRAGASLPPWRVRLRYLRPSEAEQNRA